MSEIVRAKIVPAGLTRSQLQTLNRTPNIKALGIRQERHWISFDEFMKRHEIAVRYEKARMAVMKLRFNRLLVDLESLELKELELLLQLKSKYDEPPTDSNAIKSLNSELEALSLNIIEKKTTTKTEIAEFFARVEKRTDNLNQLQNPALSVNSQSQLTIAADTTLLTREKTISLQADKDIQINFFTGYIIGANPEMEDIKEKIAQWLLIQDTLAMYQDDDTIKGFKNQFTEIENSLKRLHSSLSEKLKVRNGYSSRDMILKKLVNKLSDRFGFNPQVRGLLIEHIDNNHTEYKISMWSILHLLKTYGVTCGLQDNIIEPDGYYYGLSLAGPGNLKGGDNLPPEIMDVLLSGVKEYKEQLRTDTITPRSKIRASHAYPTRHEIESTIESFKIAIKWAKQHWEDPQSWILPTSQQRAELKAPAREGISLEQGQDLRVEIMNIKIAKNVSFLVGQRDALEAGRLSPTHIKTNLEKILELFTINVEWDTILNRYVVYNKLSNGHEIGLMPDSETSLDRERALTVLARNFISVLRKVDSDGRCHYIRSERLIGTIPNLEQLIKNICGFSISRRWFIRPLMRSKLVVIQKEIRSIIEDKSVIRAGDSEGEKAILQELEKLLNQFCSGCTTQQKADLKKLVDIDGELKSADQFFKSLHGVMTSAIL